MIIRTILVIAAGLACLVAAVLGIGALLPRDHVADGEIALATSPDAASALIGDPTTYARWRKGVAFSDIRAEADAVFWRETAHGRGIDYGLTKEAPRRWRSTILTKSLPYGGYWIIEVKPRGAGSSVHITEHGFVDNLTFRTLGRFIFGLDASLKAYLHDLSAAVRS